MDLRNDHFSYFFKNKYAHVNRNVKLPISDWDFDCLSPWDSPMYAFAHSTSQRNHKKRLYENTRIS